MNNVYEIIGLILISDKLQVIAWIMTYFVNSFEILLYLNLITNNVYCNLHIIACLNCIYELSSEQSSMSMWSSICLTSGSCRITGSFVNEYIYNMQLVIFWNIFSFRFFPLCILTLLVGSWATPPLLHIFLKIIIMLKVFHHVCILFPYLNCVDQQSAILVHVFFFIIESQLISMINLIPKLHISYLHTSTSYLCNLIPKLKEQKKLVNECLNDCL